MRGKLHKRLSNIEAELTRLARAAELHPTADHINDVRDEVKAARSEIAEVVTVTQTGLKAVTDTLGGVLARTAEAVAAPVAAAKPRNGKAGPTAPAEPGKDDA